MSLSRRRFTREFKLAAGVAALPFSVRGNAAGADPSGWLAKKGKSIEPL